MIIPVKKLASDIVETLHVRRSRQIATDTDRRRIAITAAEKFFAMALDMELNRHVYLGGLLERHVYEFLADKAVQCDQLEIEQEKREQLAGRHASEWRSFNPLRLTFEQGSVEGGSIREVAQQLVQEMESEVNRHYGDADVTEPYRRAGVGKSARRSDSHFTTIAPRGVHATRPNRAARVLSRTTVRNVAP